MATPRELYVNLPVADLARSMEFFSTLGFEFDARFTDDRAAAMIVSEHAGVMLLDSAFFRTFTERLPCDTSSQTEVLVAFSCEGRSQVDALVEKAGRFGGSAASGAQDHGFMYQRSFYDPDGHHWEAFWMDPAHTATRDASR